MPAAEHTVSLPDRYRVTRRIASGGMATVYACEDQVLGRLVAVKVLSPAFAADQEAIARFQREARAVAKVSDHPNVVTIYDIGEHAGAAFIVMEYFAGGTVADRLRSGDPIPRPGAVRWLSEAASALDHAHRAGIVHRDVKPANLLLDANGRLAVADFGIARMASEAGVTTTGTVLGTAAYLSPEQALGQRATAASDRYAFAVVAFELLTGRKPFQGEHVAAQARAHVESAPPAASALAGGLSAGVDRALWRGMEKEPEHRWPTAAAMVEAIEDALGDEAEPVEITAATTPLRAHVRSSAAPRHRSWATVLSAALIIGLLAGGAIAALIGGGDDNKSSGTTSSARRTTTAAPKRTPAPAQTTSTPSASAASSPSELEAKGHQLVLQGSYNQAIPVLQQATKGCDVQTTDPCAFAYFDLGRALRLAGRPAEAIPFLETGLQNNNQHRVVQHELDQARAEAGQGGPPGKPGKKPKKPKHGDEGD